MPVHVFPDTNIWLHCRPLEDVDWPTVLDTDAVVIVASTPLIRELDKRKYDGRTRDRARRALNQIGDWANGLNTGLRTNVTGVYWEPSRRPDVAGLGLDREQGDDVMVAFAHAYAAAHAGERVVFLTDDLGPRLTARRLGLQPVEPPETARQAAPLDPLEAELRKTKRELLELERRLPRPRVSIVGGAGDGSRVAVQVRQVAEPLDAFRGRVLAEAEHRVPRIDPAPPGLTVLEPGNRKAKFDLAGVARLRASFDSIQASEFERYAKEREDYLKAVAAIAEKNWRVADANARTVLLTLRLENEGTAPADNTDVILHIPDGPDVRTKLLEEKSLPDPPQAPRTHMEMIADMSRSFAYQHNDLYRPSGLSVGPPANVSAPHIKRTNSHEITWHVRLVKQYTPETLGDVALVFPTTDNVRSLTLACRIVSASLPRPLESELHLIVSRA